MNRKNIVDKFFIGEVKKKFKKKFRKLKVMDKCRLCGKRVPNYHHTLCDKCWLESRQVNYENGRENK